MKTLIGLAATIGLASAAAAPARADVIVLTFEGVGDQASINDFYNGGTDSAGNSGTNYGISFSSDSLGLVSELGGGAGLFQGNPSGSTVAFFLSGAGDVMNVAAGFTTGFSFFYSSSQAGTVNVYSGLNGTGDLLAQVPIDVNYNANCAADATEPYCNFSSVGVNFAGTAESVIFGGTANNVAYDDITIGSANAGSTDVPEPATMLVLGTGLLGIGAARRRRA